MSSTTRFGVEAPMPTQCLNRRIANKQTLMTEVAAWEGSRNHKHAKSSPQTTPASNSNSSIRGCLATEST
jgi:hypothetical protein